MNNSGRNRVFFQPIFKRVTRQAKQASPSSLIAMRVLQRLIIELNIQRLKLDTLLGQTKIALTSTLALHDFSRQVCNIELTPVKQNHHTLANIPGSSPVPAP